MNKALRLNMILIILIFLVTAAALTFLAYQKIDAYNTVTAEIEKENKALQQDNILFGQLKKLRDQEAALKGYAAAYENLFPDTPEESKLVAYIQKIAGEVPVDFVQIRFDPRVKGEKYMEMPINITFEANYPSFLTFLNKVESGSRAIRIDGVDVALSDKGDSTIRAELDAKAFYRGDGGQ